NGGRSTHRAAHDPSGIERMADGRGLRRSASRCRRSAPVCRARSIVPEMNVSVHGGDSPPRAPPSPRRSPGGEALKALSKYPPRLRACELEDRLLPVTPNLGAIVLTTGGDVLLLSPFPVIAADPFGQSGGPGFLTPSALSGSAGVVGLLPWNSAGVP